MIRPRVAVLTLRRESHPPDLLGNRITSPLNGHFSRRAVGLEPLWREFDRPSVGMGWAHVRDCCRFGYRWPNR
jgi:hypothetical protein